MSVADSGEYVCQANNNIDALEASIVVSVSPGTGGPSGESRERPRKGAGDAGTRISWGGKAL